MHPLEERIGYKFRNSLLLAEALTHASLGHETQQTVFDNQRLEYLGDAVLQLLVADLLYQRFRDADEGYLSKGRSQLVSGQTLAVYARRLHLGDHLMMGPSDERNGGRRRTSTLGDAFEALVGAMYLDGGLEVVRAFILQQAGDQLTTTEQGPPRMVNPKGDLQEILQALPPRAGYQASPRNPSYAIVAQVGPDHARTFTAQVVWNGLVLGQGEGGSKQQAESAAAIDALRGERWVAEGARGTRVGDEAVAGVVSEG